MKFGTTRLKQSNYDIQINLSEARKNNEVVRIGDSNLLEFLRRIKKENYSAEELQKTENELKKVRKSKNTEKNRDKVASLQYAIDKHLFIPEIVSIVFDDNRHYKKLAEKGLFINGNRYIRLYSGAGNARRATAFFIDEKYYEKMDWYLDCGRKEKPMSLNKYNSYYSLASSGGTPITTPRFTVIKDLEITRPTLVDFVSESEEGVDPKVEEKIIEQAFNLFDGEGLMTPSFANQIAYDLEVDYTPSAAIIRSAWIKGLLVTFDFKEFARINGITKITDIYGNSVNVEDLDVILTESRFKLSSGYDSLEQYKEEVAKRDFGWRISRISPKQEKNIVQTNYQYLQVLDLSDDDIVELCKPTVDYFKSLSGLDYNAIMIFLIGSLKEEDITPAWFSKLDPLIKLLFYEPLLIENGFVRNKIKKMISRKIKDSYIGVLNVEGNYQFAISDPYALCQHAFGMEVTGLLNSREFYCQYWNEKNVDKVAALRSPLTWKSEVNILDLRNNKNLQFWYKYLTSGIVYNVFDESVMSHSGSDFDGDIICTTNNKQIINGAAGGVPVTYERKTAPKSDINKDKLWETDVLAFFNKIGFITNVSSTLHSLISLLEPNSPEYLAVVNRLKILTAFQSMSIDKAKGIAVMDFPDWWTKWKKDDDFNNSILADKRPLFFRWLYDHYNREYKKYQGIYDTFCISNYGKSLREILESEVRTKQQLETVYYYGRYNRLVETPSVMNKVCRHMEKEVSLMKDSRNNMSFDFDVNYEDFIEMREIYSEWKRNRKKHVQDGDKALEIETRNQCYGVSSNSNEIAKLALNTSIGFALTVLPNEVEGLYRKSFKVPVLCKNGEIDFNGEKYSLIKFEVRDYG